MSTPEERVAEYERANRQHELCEWVFQNARDVRPVVSRIMELEDQVKRLKAENSACPECGYTRGWHKP